jgi:excisionase family DNA binding protein
MGPGSITETMTPRCELEAYVDAKEAAVSLRIYPKTLMRLVHEGRVPAYSFSEGTRRHWRFLTSELDNWMETKVNISRGCKL